MSRVFIGVGSNEGDRLQQIARALDALKAIEGIRVVQMAMLMETQPLGGPPQGPYLNTVVELETMLEPAGLLQALKRIERQGGRARSGARWGPRPIDLDILLYDDRVVDQPDLHIPHPRLHERSFVLQPLAQLAPAVVHPVLGQTIAQLAERLTTTRTPR